MIIGFSFTDIHVQRKKPSQQGMKVTYDIDFSDVKEETIVLGKGQKAVSFAFTYKTQYKPDIADVSISGAVTYLAPEAEAKTILETWKSSKKIPKNVSVPVINMALDKSSIKALELEQDLGLPPHVPMPSVKAPSDSKEAEQYIG